MSQLIRLVYASQSHNVPGRGALDSSIGSILSQSRRNNQKQQIGGVLFFGEGYFFQCLEGEKKQVEALYHKICQDPRHHNARILHTTTIKDRLFSDWSMKFVPTAEEVQQLLRQYGFQRFRPFEFPPQMVEELIQYFHYAQMTVQLDPDPQSFHQEIGASQKSEGGIWQKLTHRLRFG